VVELAVAGLPPTSNSNRYTIFSAWTKYNAMTVLDRSSSVRRRQSLGLAILLGLMALAVGCPVRDLPPPGPAAETSDRGATDLVSTRSLDQSSEQPTELGDWVDRVLRANRDNRKLSTEVNAAWQIMHGVLAYGQQLSIATSAGPQAAVPYMLSGGSARGFELRGGDWFDVPASGTAPTTRVRGVVAELQPGSKIGQGHRDQWVAYMARCGLSGEDTVVTSDGTLTLDGWVRQIQWDVPRNFEQEFSWTLTALVAHRPTTDRWKARDGLDYSIESLLQSEIRQLSPSSACGGSHRLCAIAGALNQHRQDGHSVIGVWAEADHLVKLAIEQAKDFQNADGSFSSHYFERPGWSLDLATALGTTGHVFEFLAVAASDEVLDQPWVKSAARFLCRTLEQTAELDLECGALYHALSGLAIYHQRLQPPAQPQT
jgi:hypothetical protein